MVTPSTLTAGTVLQTSGGWLGISTELWLLIGIAVVFVLAAIWILTLPRG